MQASRSPAHCAWPSRRSPSEADYLRTMTQVGAVSSVPEIASRGDVTAGSFRLRR